MPAFPVLPPALTGERCTIDSAAGPLSFYVAGPDTPSSDLLDPVPLLLVHSINAAASAYEVAPLYEHYRKTRTVYALDLPGYGFSDRSARFYSLHLMTDAVLALTTEIAARHGDATLDAVGVSLSSEYVARAAAERPQAFRSVALVSATGLNRKRPFDAPPGTSRGRDGLLKNLSQRPWSAGLYRLLTRPGVIRFFLNKTWGSKNIDDGLLAYDVITVRQPGAANAPFHFLSFHLFSADITRVYEQVQAPVWLVHGVRGDFVDYRGSAHLVATRGWQVHVMQTGAMPYFEDLPGFTSAYDDFLRHRVAGPPG